MPGKRDIPLYLFAKEPVAGQVKTRLASRLGHDNCARLAAQMLQQSASQVCKHWQGQLVLCVTPRMDAPLFHRMVEAHHCGIYLQQGESLGDRMRDVLDAGIHTAGASVVMGCDVPHISGNILQQAYEGLARGENVIGPAEDGGFYLLGLQDPVRGLFDDITWGGEQVMEKMLANATHNDRKFTMLPGLRDIDLWDDLVWLAGVQKQYASYIETSSAPSMIRD